MVEGQGCCSSKWTKRAPTIRIWIRSKALVEEPWYLGTCRNYFITSPLTSHISVEPMEMLNLVSLRPAFVNQTSQDINYSPCPTWIDQEVPVPRIRFPPVSRTTYNSSWTWKCKCCWFSIFCFPNQASLPSQHLTFAFSRYWAISPIFTGDAINIFEAETDGDLCSLDCPWNISG